MRLGRIRTDVVERAIATLRDKKSNKAARDEAIVHLVTFAEQGLELRKQLESAAELLSEFGVVTKVTLAEELENFDEGLIARERRRP